MALISGSTVQCTNSRCEARGYWLKAAEVVSGQCPKCGESVRNVPPPLMPRHHFRPRAIAPRPPLRPR